MEIKIMLAAAVFFGGWLLSYVFLRQLLFNFRVAYPLLNKMNGIDPELIAPGARVKEMFTEILDELSHETGLDRTPDLINYKIASMACKASVKGNTRMTTQELEALLDELLTLDNPYNCPHGRPTMISMTKYEIDKKFKRVVE